MVGSRGEIAFVGMLLGLAAGRGLPADNQVTAPQVVSALEQSFGVHPGERRNHSKGTCALGEFIGNKDAVRYSRSALFAGKTLPVVARFSVAGGNPQLPDTAKNARGMALEFRLPDGKSQHITMINTPMFGAATPRTFFDNIVATRPDPATGKPDPAKVKDFLKSHPDAVAQSEFLLKNNQPPSWANSAYFGIHTFKFIDAAGKATLVRWEFVPQDGEKRLTDEQLKTAGSDFLERALIDRARRGPVRWDMFVTIGESGDPVTDPTVLWPQGRRQFKAGTLTITSAMPQKGAECESINYDPLIMADGIEPTDDPILKFRSPAYAVSFGKRRSGQ